MSLSATSTCLLNISRGCDSTTSLGSLSQCLTTLSVKKFFLISNLNLPWCNLRPLPLSCYLEKETDSHLPTTSSFWVVVESNNVSLSLLFSRLNNPSSHIQLASDHQSSLSRSLCRDFLPSSRSTLPPYLVLSANLLKVQKIRFVQITNKDVKKNWPQYWALGKSTCDQPPTGFNSIHYHSLGLAIQTVFYSEKHMPIWAMSSQFPQKNAVGKGVKGSAKV